MPKPTARLPEDEANAEADVMAGYERSAGRGVFYGAAASSPAEGPYKAEFDEHVAERLSDLQHSLTSLTRLYAENARRITQAKQYDVDYKQSLNAMTAGFLGKAASSLAPSPSPSAHPSSLLLLTFRRSPSLPPSFSHNSSRR